MTACEHEFNAGEVRIEVEERLPGIRSITEVGVCAKCGTTVSSPVPE